MKNKILLLCALINLQQLNAAENIITRTQGIDDRGYAYIEYYNPENTTWARGTVIDGRRLYSDFKLEDNNKKQQHDHVSLARFTSLEELFTQQEAAAQEGN